MEWLNNAMAPVLGLIGVSVGAWLTGKRERRHWHMDQKLKSYASVMNFFSALITNDEDPEFFWNYSLDLSTASALARLIAPPPIQGES